MFETIHDRMARLPREAVRIGLVSISDLVSTGVYTDEGLPALQARLDEVPLNPLNYVTRLIPDEQAQIEETLRTLCDQVVAA